MADDLGKITLGAAVSALTLALGVTDAGAQTMPGMPSMPTMPGGRGVPSTPAPTVRPSVNSWSYDDESPKKSQYTVPKSSPVADDESPKENRYSVPNSSSPVGYDDESPKGNRYSLPGGAASTPKGN